MDSTKIISFFETETKHVSFKTEKKIRDGASHGPSCASHRSRFEIVGTLCGAVRRPCVYEECRGPAHSSTSINIHVTYAFVCRQEGKSIEDRLAWGTYSISICPSALFS